MQSKPADKQGLGYIQEPKNHSYISSIIKTNQNQMHKHPKYLKFSDLLHFYSTVVIAAYDREESLSFEIWQIKKKNLSKI